MSGVARSLRDAVLGDLQAVEKLARELERRGDRPGTVALRDRLRDQVRDLNRWVRKLDKTLGRMGDLEALWKRSTVHQWIGLRELERQGESQSVFVSGDSVHKALLRRSLVLESGKLTVLGQSYLEWVTPVFVGDPTETGFRFLWRGLEFTAEVVHPPPLSRRYPGFSADFSIHTEGGYLAVRLAEGESGEFGAGVLQFDGRHSYYIGYIGQEWGHWLRRDEPSWGGDLTPEQVAQLSDGTRISVLWAGTEIGGEDHCVVRSWQGVPWAWDCQGNQVRPLNDLGEIGSPPQTAVRLVNTYHR